MTPTPLTNSGKEVKQLLLTAKKLKDSAYKERNQLVAFVSKLYPSHLCRHPNDDKTWEATWRWIVCIHSPNGQLTWHIHDREKKLFKHLKIKKEHWDGHTTEQKYNRLARIKVYESR